MTETAVAAPSEDVVPVDEDTETAVDEDTETAVDGAAETAVDEDTETAVDEDTETAVDGAAETAEGEAVEAGDDEDAQPEADDPAVDSDLEDGEAESESDAEQAGDQDAPAGVDAETQTVTQAETRVLEFTLGDEQYCLDIEYIEEIVKRNTITRVPNTEDFVEGVVDLRGQITTILNPKEVIGIDEEGSEQLIIVFDADEFDEQGNIGWLVDDVKQVTPVIDTEVNESPMEREYINGIIDRKDDDDFVIWTSPDLALEEASS
ncbi:chemotaxis protein CheW [Haloarculaceae archaeon H-GB11]|nr:chemotaxis protein CheW [Haloarculaceae archaeon H-GB11]